MKTNTNNEYNPDDQVKHDLASDQILLAAGFLASCVNTDAATQPTADEYAINQRNIEALKIVVSDIEDDQKELETAKAEKSQHERLIDPKNHPKNILKISGYVGGMTILGGAILVNTGSYALKHVDNLYMAGAFSLSILGLAAGKELAIQTSSEEIKEKAHAISKVGLLVCGGTYVFALVNKFGLELAMDATSLLAQTDDRILLCSQLFSEICIFSLAAGGLAKLLEKMKHPVVNTRYLYFENLIKKSKTQLSQLIEQRLDLKQAICAFEVKRKRYEAFCGFIGKNSTSN